MLVTFGLPILVQFSSNIYFIRWHPYFLLRYLSSICHCWFSPSTALKRMCTVRRWGREGGVTKVAIFHGHMRKIILMRGLLRQPEFWCLNWFITLGGSVAVYKKKTTTHINIIQISILFRESVDVHQTISTTHINNFQIYINDQWIQTRAISTTCS